MVDDALTGAARALLQVTIAMRLFPVLPAALCAAIGLPPRRRALGRTRRWSSTARDNEMRERILDLLPRPRCGRRRCSTPSASPRKPLRARWRGCALKAITPQTVTPEAQRQPASARAGDRARPALSVRCAATARIRRRRARRSRGGHAADAIDAIDANARGARCDCPQAEGDALAALQQAVTPTRAPATRRVVVDHATRAGATEFRFNAGALCASGRRARRPRHCVPRRASSHDCGTGTMAIPTRRKPWRACAAT